MEFRELTLFSLALGTILYSCGSSVHVLFPYNDAFRPQYLKTEAEDQQEINGTTFIFMLIMGSISLLLIFYLLATIINVFKFLILIGGVSSVAFVIWDWIFYVFKSKYSTYITFGYSILIILIWYQTEHFIITNFLVFCFVVCGINMVKIRRLQVILFVTIGFLLYDVWWVFISPLFFGKSVMEVAARAASTKIPAAMTAPEAPMPSNQFEGGASLLGAGDIMLPGIVIDFFIRFDCSYQTNLFEVSFVGYILGLFIAWAMVFLMQKGQPALLWIFPSILIPTLIYAKYNNILGILWREGTSKYDHALETRNNEQNMKNEGVLDIDVDFEEAS